MPNFRCDQWQFSDRIFIAHYQIRVVCNIDCNHAEQMLKIAEMGYHVESIVHLPNRGVLWRGLEKL